MSARVSPRSSARLLSPCTAGFASVALALGLALVGGAARAGDGELPPYPKHPPAPDPRPDPKPVQKTVDLAICLDTSGSMEGLINAARTKLWSVVNELATARPTPVLRVALLTYGSAGTEQDGYVITQTPFTTDLDLVSEKLFRLTTNGGTEYVGRVVKTAVDALQWGGPDAAKILFVAGNESADQDRAAPFREVVKHAAGLGVRVNSIYCGDPDDADAPGWREVAALGLGRYASIDHNQGTVVVATPFDAELAELSQKINKTYLGYGRLAKEAGERQSAQDANAAGAAPGAAAGRAASKAGALYDNSGWDLVDKSREKDFDLAKVPVEDLPEDMRAMTLEQRQAHLAKKTAERAEIQARIKDLDAKRQAAIRDEMAKKGLDDGKAFDRALRDIVREQAAEKGFTFPTK
jgi:hypothetical protein